jgi:aspartyl-tRNA(Asn)/glutamyl-tRNA(Gln) amidotransferase subunit A
MAIPLEILYAPLSTLAEKLKAKAFTSEELTRAYLDRLEKIGSKLGAVATVLRESSLTEAKKADMERAAGKVRGPLHGIPYGAKDLLAAKGAPTTWGAEPYKEQTFDFDATVVRKLREAGAILVAKLAMVELAGSFGYEAADSCWTGPCRTPWDLKRWSGGSSSGSGAAVASGLVPFAIGSETSGSIITPASYCGITGLRPTYGRVSRAGAMPLCWTLDKLGPMARTADCCARVLEAIAGRDAADDSTTRKPFRATAFPAERKWKIGILAAATTGIDASVRANFDKAIEVLSGFATIVKDVKLPSLPFGSVLGTILRGEGATVFRTLFESGEAKKLRSSGMRLGGYAALTLPATEYLDAMRARTRMRNALQKTYASFDAIVAPGRAELAPNADGPFRWSGAGGAAIGALITSTNLIGLPAVCVPTGFSASGLPTSLQFTGPAWKEAELLALASRYQSKTTHHGERPPEKNFD